MKLKRNKCTIENVKRKISIILIEKHHKVIFDIKMQRKERIHFDSNIQNKMCMGHKLIKIRSSRL